MATVELRESGGAHGLSPPVAQPKRLLLACGAGTFEACFRLGCAGHNGLRLGVGPGEVAPRLVEYCDLLNNRPALEHPHQGLVCHRMWEAVGGRPEARSARVAAGHAADCAGYSSGPDARPAPPVSRAGRRYACCLFSMHYWHAFGHHGRGPCQGALDYAGWWGDGHTRGRAEVARIDQ